VDHLDAEVARERRPAGAVRREACRPAGVGRDRQQRLLDEMGDEAGIGAMGQHRGRAAGEARRQRQRGFAQRVVRALGRRERRVGVAAGPGLDAGVEVEGAARLRELDQRDGRDVDRQVQQEVARAEQLAEHLAVVGAGERRAVEGDAVLARDLGAALLGGHDRDVRARHVDVAQQERQDTLADRAEAQDHHAAGIGDVLRVEPRGRRGAELRHRPGPCARGKPARDAQARRRVGRHAPRRDVQQT